MLDRRLQLLIDDDRYRRLTAEARKRRVSVATVVREAIDSSLNNDSERRSKAVRRLLDMPDFDGPTTTKELLAEIKAARDARARHVLGL